LEAAVTVGQRTEDLTRFEVMAEDLETHFRAIAEMTAATAGRVALMEVKFEKRFEEVERQIMVLDVKVEQKLEALDAKFETKFNTLDTKVEALDTKVEALDTKVEALDTKVEALDTKFDAMSTELSRITAHLGLGGPSRSARPRPRGAAKRRKPS
jgi:chromosome segregation ATPase